MKQLRRPAGVCHSELGGGAAVAPVYASQTMWQMRPMQSGSLQGLYSAKSVDLAGGLPGIGSRWQESKEDWGLPAVMGEHI